jgi:hypothetical protein
MSTTRLSKKQRLELIDEWNNGHEDQVRNKGFEVCTTKTGKIQVKHILTDEDKAKRKAERKEKAPAKPQNDFEEDVWEPSEYIELPKVSYNQPIKSKPLTKDQKMLKSKAIQSMKSKKQIIDECNEDMVDPYIIENDHEDTYLKPDHKKTSKKAPVKKIIFDNDEPKKPSKKSETTNKNKQDSDTYIIPESKPNIL